MGSNKKGDSFASYIMSDLSRIVERRATMGDLLKYYFMPRGTTFKYVFWFRAVQSLKQNGHKALAIVPYLIMRRYEFKYGIHANTNIHIGKGLMIVHGGAVYLNCKEIGENFTVYQCVTLGTRKYGDEFRNDVPWVGDNVTMYTGAVVCGDIKVGNNVTIGAHAYVDKNLDDGATVIGPRSYLV